MGGVPVVFDWRRVRATARRQIRGGGECVRALVCEGERAALAQNRRLEGEAF